VQVTVNYDADSPFMVSSSFAWGFRGPPPCIIAEQFNNVEEFS
jgi:hypothetical protein